MAEIRPAMLHDEVAPQLVVPHAVKSLARAINSAIMEHGTALVGFTGSKSLHELYANLGLETSVDWTKVFFFAVDDNVVPGCPR